MNTVSVEERLVRPSVAVSMPDIADSADTLDIQVIAADPAGRASASGAKQWNAGLRAARTEWVLFLAPGDELLPDALTLLRDIVDRTPAADVVYGASYWMQAARHQGQAWRGGEVTPAAFAGQCFEKMLVSAPPALCATMIRRTRAVAAGGFDEAAYLADRGDLVADLFLRRLAKLGASFAGSAQGVACAAQPRETAVPDLPASLRSLNDLIADVPAATASAARVRACLDAARVFVRLGRDAEAKNAYQQAAQVATPSDAQTVADAMMRDALDFHRGQRVAATTTAHGFIDSMLADASPTLRQRALSTLHTTLAFESHALCQPSSAVRHALTAIRTGAPARTNRDVYKLALKNIVGNRRSIVQSALTRGDALLQSLIQSESIFISPHFDDTSLSCGGLLALLARHKANATLVTVFTADAADPAHISPLAQSFRALWTDARDPYEVRGAEELAVARRLGFAHQWLGFAEASCRYPRLRSSNELANGVQDEARDPVYAEVAAALQQVLAERPNATVFAPLAVGHLDHRLVHRILVDLSRRGMVRNPILFYEDYPYSARSNLAGRLITFRPVLTPVAVRIDDALADRLNLIQLYASQMTMLFPSAEAAQQELTDFATSIAPGHGALERYWRHPAG